MTKTKTVKGRLANALIMKAAQLQAVREFIAYLGAEERKLIEQLDALTASICDSPADIRAVSATEAAVEISTHDRQQSDSTAD